MRFPLGKITVTLTASTALAASNTHLLALLVRHGLGDSGVCPSKDAEVGIRDSLEVWSRYKMSGTEVFVEVYTTADRAATTVFVGDNEVPDAV